MSSVQQTAWQLRGRIADLGRRIEDQDRLLRELENAISTVELELEALPQEDGDGAAAAAASSPPPTTAGESSPNARHPSTQK